MPQSTELAELISQLAPKSGQTATAIPGVTVSRFDERIPRTPMMYSPSVIVIARGRKSVWLGEERFDYDANNYLVLSAPMPMDCEATPTPGEPLLALTIELDPITVGELLLDTDHRPTDEKQARVVGATNVTHDLLDAATRLASVLNSPLHARILGRQIIREIVFHALLGPQGDTVRMVATSSGRQGQIARVLRRIHDDYASELDVSSLAREANMGTSTFHHAFRDVTSTTPLQYIKQTRLHRARTLLMSEGVSVQEAAYSVGYVSPSQFGREYRRMFGVSPAADRALTTA
ncbi:MAG: AraC family transcriptional regulator [Actinomycetota bacterium]|nr:MAG: AraC family transcriptional [Actinomycetota bacterium]MDO8950501.1 AraC family transcriptional regulator [Actinomycetota bacterium]MDP3630739.1 AraC family transcriptional regulator [Actinomycetota bacterium]